MSQQNVEILRRANEAFNTGGIPAARPYFTEDVEFHEPPEQPAPRAARGIDDVARLFGEFDATWLSHRSEIEGVQPLDNDRLLVFSIEHFRGRDGIEVSAPAGAVFTFRDGKIVRWEAFWDRQHAREAVGLSEDP